MKKEENKVRFFCITASAIIITLMLSGQGLFALENGLCRTPPMGWNAWNIFGGDINETKIKEIADAMVSSGMKDAGYIYINLDDMWMQAGRDAGGNLVADPVKFPNGMKALADYIHSLGLKLGLYGDRGTATCCNVFESGSQGHEAQDANTWASWGIDYIKYDSCNASLDLQTQYETMRDALAQCGRPIAYSICCWYYAGDWMTDCGNLWRTTGDITDSFSSFCSIIDTNEKLYSHAGPGHWNDPDMLEVGNGNCTYEEYKAHFSIWCIMAAPLIAGNDLRSMSPETISILCNTEVIAVDQDSAGIQGHIIRDDGDRELWMKPLGSSTGSIKAVALFNRGSSSATISVSWSEIALSSGSATVRDLWVKSDLGSFTDSYSASVPGHGVVMLKITGAGNATAEPTLPVIETDAPTMAPTEAPATAEPTVVPTGDPGTQAPTDAVTETPVPTSTPGPTAVPTSTPFDTPAATPDGVTVDPTAPTAVTPDTTSSATESPSTPPSGTTAPGTCTCTNLCSSQTSVSVPFTYDGSGEYCWISSSLGSYINSWNADAVNINGTNCTNTYVSSSSISASDNVYYIYYKGSYTWSHIEIK